LTGEHGHAAAMEGRVSRSVRQDYYCCNADWRSGR
jgi:hypothetical protein